SYRCAFAVMCSRRILAVLRVRHPEPLHKTVQAFFDLGLWIVAEQRAGLGNVGEGLRNVAGLRRLAIDRRRHVELFLQQRNSLVQFDCSRFAEVEHFVIALVVIDRRHDAVDYVVDVGVIATCGAVAENRDWFTLGYEFGEFVNREIRALAWSIDCEKSKTDAAQSVEMRISMAEKFARAFRGGVGRDGLAYRIVFAERYLGVDSIDRRRGAENELLDLVVTRELEHVERAVDVCLVVELWFGKRRSYACAGCEMDQAVEVCVFKYLFECCTIANVCL